MNSAPYLSLLVTIILSLKTVHSQTWTGSFTWDSECDTTQCCCPTGAMTTSKSGFSLLMRMNLVGCSTSLFTYSFAYPNGYSFTTAASFGEQTYTLSSDGTTISSSFSAYTYCNGIATRVTSSTSDAKSISPVSSVLLMASAGIWLASRANSE
jgi:hypothetical protein